MACLYASGDNVISFGPEKGKVTYSFSVVDSITGRNVKDLEILGFVPGDSAVIAKGFSLNVIMGMREKELTYIKFPATDSCDYQIYIDASGYLPRTIPVSVHNGLSGREFGLGEIALLKEPKKLNEVTVTASRVKLYYDGDTLVYNADAFLLPEGSMLDDLIRKLDGVTINRSGEIYCRGRKVESLMLDGRKLFNGNPRMLMQNLGAYTVKKIKVYDYTSKEDKFLGYSANGQKPMVMDVVLKQQFSIGKWVNLDAGYGTSNRYLGRLFALGFTKKVAIAAFANINNLSTGDNPDRYDEWSPGKAGTSDSRYISGGLSYQYDSSTLTFSGDAAVNTDKVNSIVGRESVNYLTGGNTYRNSFNNSLTRNLSVNTKHNWYMQFPKATLTLTPQFSYSHNRSDGSTTSAVFDDDMRSVTAAAIEAMYSGNADSLLIHAINRNMSLSQSKGNGLSGSLGARTLVPLPKLADGVNQNLTINVNGSYSNNRSDSYNRNTINYGRDSEPAYDFYALRRVGPSWRAYGNGSATYNLNIREQHIFMLTYAYSHNHDLNTSDRYLLSNLDKASLVGLRFAELPPDVDLSAVIDPDNSRKTRYLTDSHRLNGWMRLQWSRTHGDRTNGIYIITAPKLEFLDRRYDYTRPNYDTTVVQSNILPSIKANINLSSTIKNENVHKSGGISFGWESNPSLISMGNLVNVSNTSDPLDIFRGNPNLRNGYRHSANVKLWWNQIMPHYHNHTLTFSYLFSDREVASGYFYDPQTGVTVNSMYNVSGYRNYSVEYRGNGDIFSKRNRNLNYNVGAELMNTRSPQMVAEGTDDGRLVPSRRFMNMTHIEPSASLTFRYGRRHHSISVGWRGSFDHSSSDAAGYQPMDLANLRYNLGLGFGLPADIRLTTSASLNTRRGYDDPALNSNEVVWNASASWTWKKQRLTFILDAYDMLGQIKVISAYSNALGRTESWKNTLPRYVLLRLRYHLDVSPK